MTEISKQCKEVLAKFVMLKPDGPNKSEVAANSRLLAQLDEGVGEMKKQLEQTKTKIELDLMRMDQKVDKSDLEGLDLKTSKEMAAFKRDLNIK